MGRTSLLNISIDVRRVIIEFAKDPTEHAAKHMGKIVYFQSSFLKGPLLPNDLLYSLVGETLIITTQQIYRM